MTNFPEICHTAAELLQWNIVIVSAGHTDRLRLARLLSARPIVTIHAENENEAVHHGDRINVWRRKKACFRFQ